MQCSAKFTWKWSLYLIQSLVTRDDDTSDEEDDEEEGEAGKETSELIPSQDGKEGER